MVTRKRGHVAWRARARHAVLAAVLGAVAGVIGPSALGQESSPESAWLQDDRSQRAAAEERARIRARDQARATPEARQRRRESRTAYRGRGAVEAAAVARRHFRGLVEGPPFEPLALESGEKIHRYRGEFGAVVETDDGRRLLAESSWPIRSTVGSGELAPVDLRLAADPSGFTPRNPLVRTHVARAAGAAVSFPDHGVAVGFRPPGPEASSGDSAIQVDNNAFYGNVAVDTDLLVTPTPSGVETLFHVRSAESPERAALHFELPERSELRLVDDGHAAEIVRRPAEPLPGLGLLDSEPAEAEPLAFIPPAAAWDAEGAPVSATYVVEGDDLVVEFPHRDRDVLYPLVIDPVVDLYKINDRDQGLRTGGTDTFSDWEYATNAPAGYMNSNTEGAKGNGLYVWTYGGASYTNGYWGQWIWKFKPTRTGIYLGRTDFSYVDHVPAGGTGVSDCIVEGVFNPTGSTWNTGHWVQVDGTQGTTPWLSNQNVAGQTYQANKNPCASFGGNYKAHHITGSTVGNEMRFGLQMINTGNRTTGATAYMYGATMWLYDNNAPTLSTPTHTHTIDGYQYGGYPGRWIRDATFTTKATVSDVGLGAKTLSLFLPRGYHGSTASGCTGMRDSRCQTSWTPPGPIHYGTADMDDGINTVVLGGYDVNSTPSAPKEWNLKVDRKGPTIGLGGSLAAAENDVVYDGAYDLAITATDGTPGGTPAEQRSGVDQVSFSVGSLSKPEWTKTNTGCLGDSCALPHTITFDPAPGDLADGTHTAQIVATDRAGNTTTRSLVFELDRLGDIYHARKYDGSPNAGGTLLAHEWARLGTSMGRFELPGLEVATRGRASCDATNPAGAQCDEFRSVTTDSADPTFQTYERHRGSHLEDPHLPWLAELTNYATYGGASSGSGSLSGVLAAWQRPPPGSGTEYLLYTSTEDTGGAWGDDSDDTTTPTPSLRTYKLWLEKRTRLPVKGTATISSGETYSTYWTYDRSRLELGELPSDFFLVAPPSSPAVDQRVDYHGAGPVGPQSDRETGEQFTTYSLGPDATVEGASFCLSTTDTIQMVQNLAAIEPEPYTAEWLAPDPSDSVDETDPDDIPSAAADVPDPRGPDTFASANYHLLLPAETCAPGARDEPDPPISVTSMASNSSLAKSMRAAHEEDGVGVLADPLAPPDLTTGGGLATAYVVPTGEGESSAFVEMPASTNPGTTAPPGTSVVITGPFDKAEVSNIVSQLEPQ